ncbi:MAG: hypothetical protein JW881_13820 [Spirochaetales bacterium]|nr:hypothetical protein [Spirochaetales bacterium]
MKRKKRVIMIMGNAVSIGYLFLLLLSCQLEKMDDNDKTDTSIPDQKTKGSATHYCLHWDVPYDNTDYRHYYSEVWYTSPEITYERETITKTNQWGYNETKEVIVEKYIDTYSIKGVVEGSGDNKTYHIDLSPDELAKNKFTVIIYAREYYSAYFWSRKWKTGPKKTDTKTFDLSYSPSYDPDVWNKNGTIQNNNCYNYARNIIKTTWTNPKGYQSGNYTKDQMIDWMEDNTKLPYMGNDAIPIPGKNQAVIALVLQSSITETEKYSNYHFYRLDRNGYWSHKHGPAIAANLDGVNYLSGNEISNPSIIHWTYNSFPPQGSPTHPVKNTDTTTYDYFVGYFLVGSKNTSGDQGIGIEH